MSTALITGASSGIGTAFAERLAAEGHDLVLVARTKDRLDAIAARLRAAHGIAVDVIPQDLSLPGAAAAITERLTRPVDLLVNNAGFGTSGRFEDIDADAEHRMLMVNVVALVDLTHALLPGMLERGHGGVINIASTAGFQPSPYFASYAATKTFVLNFSLALWAEYEKRGVRVLAVCPGPTETAFFDGMSASASSIGGKVGTPEEIATLALGAYDRNSGYVVAKGSSNFAMAHLTPRRPRRFVTRVSRGMTAKMAGVNPSA
ncbi:dehydrogenase [Actinorhabdospora filicis]|uniref:Dehydrogenase n=1 Tax=Actinorhabdospora filicis TaxID=1785913 RepID=A0A9W6SKJ7_9ACTN|nr:SDR family oxidoreductase [Actinorhabdospora filicis]GLZ77943.1 dehydrogenase [Actinorhabdospora filicis]